MPAKVCQKCESVSVTDGQTCNSCGSILEDSSQFDSFSAKSKRDLLDPEVEKMIPSNEEVIFFTDCSIRGRNTSDANFVGKIIITSKSVYLVKRKFKVFGKPDPLTKESMPISQITGVDQTYEKYLTVKSHHVRITRASNEDTLYGLSEHSASAIVENIQNQINNLGTTPAQVVMSIDPIEQLTKLAALLEKGLITQDEFNKKKQELL